MLPLISNLDTITGAVTRESLFQYNDQINKEFVTNSAYEWNVLNPGNITAIKLTGKINPYILMSSISGKVQDL